MNERKKSNYKLILILSVSVLLAGCGILLPANQPDTNEQNATEVADRVSFQLTKQVLQDLVVQLTSVAVASTPINTATLPPPTPVQNTPMSVIPTLPLQPTSTVPTINIPPTATPNLALCNHAQYIRDVSIPDGTVLGPSTDFTKIWRIKNIGTCVWGSRYAVEFVSGDRMEASRNVPIGQTVYPGDTVDIEVDMVAPNKSGRYQGEWILATDQGVRFGIGNQANSTFWVAIKVLAPNSNYAYDFAVNMCAASWKTSAGNIACPSLSTDSDGSIDFMTNPIFETGRHEDEATLWVRPEAVKGGWIAGTYPKYKIKTNDYFVAEVGCLIDNPGCSVSFMLEYLLDGKVKTLGEWNEKYDGYTTKIFYNLSDYAGKEVQFILKVYNDGKPGKGNAFWFVPSIRNILPPTATPTVTPVPPTPTATATQVPPTPTATLDFNTIPAAIAARDRLAQDLAVDTLAIMVNHVENVVWQDSCLEVHLPELNCTAASIGGYRVILIVATQMYEAHTNADGSLIYWFAL